jgi:flagellar basal body-associated protein FliL
MLQYLSYIQLPTVILLLVCIIAIFLTVYLLVKRQKRIQEEQEALKQEQVPNNPMEFPQIQADLPNTNVPAPAKFSSGTQTKFVLLIIISALVAVILPLATIMFLNNKSDQSTVGSCNTVTLTDSKGAVLNNEKLALLKQGDEIKILISAKGIVSKARFRVNAGNWQEVTLKDRSNFVASYKLATGVKKFLIEAQIFDSKYGWL